MFASFFISNTCLAAISWYCWKGGFLNLKTVPVRSSVMRRIAITIRLESVRSRCCNACTDR